MWVRPTRKNIIEFLIKWKFYSPESHSLSARIIEIGKRLRLTINALLRKNKEYRS